MSDGFVPLELVARSGREKAFEPTDPMEPVAVSLATPGFDGVAAMGRTFVEEFAMMGWSASRVGQLFRSAEYTGCHTIYRRRGSRFVDRLVAEVYGRSSDA